MQRNITSIHHVSPTIPHRAHIHHPSFHIPRIFPLGSENTDLIPHSQDFSPHTWQCSADPHPTHDSISPSGSLHRPHFIQYILHPTFPGRRSERSHHTYHSTFPGLSSWIPGKQTQITYRTPHRIDCVPQTTQLAFPIRTADRTI